MRSNIARTLPRRRLLTAAGFVAAFLAVLALAAGVTLAHYSTMKSSGNSEFSSGTVTIGSPAITTGCALSGVVPGRTTSTATLNAVLNSGTNYSSITVTALAKAVALNDKLLIGQGSTTQMVTASAAAALNATTIMTGSFTPSNTYAVGVMVTDLTAQNTPCTFGVTYSGSVSAYVAADILVVAGDSTPHAALWDSTANGLQFVMTDASNNTFTVPATATVSCSTGIKSQFGSVGSGRATCDEIDDDLLATSGVGHGTSFALSLNWVLPASSLSSAQGGNAQVYVIFHAVQAANNTLSCTPTLALGQPCAAHAPFAWN